MRRYASLTISHLEFLKCLQHEQADVSVVKKNYPAVNNVRDNVDARPAKCNAALNANSLRQLRS